MAPRLKFTRTIVIDGEVYRIAGYKSVSEAIEEFRNFELLTAELPYGYVGRRGQWVYEWAKKGYVDADIDHIDAPVVERCIKILNMTLVPEDTWVDVVGKCESGSTHYKNEHIDVPFKPRFSRASSLESAL